MLWSLTPAQVAELVSRIPLAAYRDISPDAPVAVGAGARFPEQQ